MKTIDLELVCEFLEEYLYDFRGFLETKEIDPVEAFPIIDAFKEKICERKAREI